MSVKDWAESEPAEWKELKMSLPVLKSPSTSNTTPTTIKTILVAFACIKRSTLRNGQKMSHAAGYFRQPETRSEN